MDDFETRIDSVDREDIWKPYVEEWLENFKSEDTPIERRIIDYRINGYGSSYNNENRIQMEVLLRLLLMTRIILSGKIQEEVMGLLIW